MHFRQEIQEVHGDPDEIQKANEVETKFYPKIRRSPMNPDVPATKLTLEPTLNQQGIRRPTERSSGLSEVPVRRPAAEPSRRSPADLRRSPADLRWSR
ncbi:hypothetical protein CRENBAI_004597 [Crenichthys baileyi]|uniref:Uncharacterized protein n=1 Tax=Crenichthys baileyi TaxID=28760 RepID=A0AAV9RE01_9TELE